jgi:Mg-chelatase subunit ChlD
MAVGDGVGQRAGVRLVIPTRRVPAWVRRAIAFSWCAAVLAAAPAAAARAQQGKSTPAASAKKTDDALISPDGAGGAAAMSTVPLRLVRCMAVSDLGCFRVIGDVKEFGQSDRFKAFLDSSLLIGPGEMRKDFDPNARLKLLIVYDVSGSMIGAGMLETRAALTDFLRRSLPPAISVSLVPFGSRGVQSEFDQAKFGTAAQAAQKLSGLAPTITANTALYSAVSFGLKLLDRETRAGGRSIMLVITDGKNDVGHNGDDPGLFSQMEQVRGAIDASPHRMWLVGAGKGVDAGELSRLAGSTGKSRTVAMDAIELKKLLTTILDEMTPRRLMVYGIPVATKAEMGRRSRQFRLSALVDSVGPWRPPLVALPVFEGVADSTLVPLRARQLADQVGDDMNLRLMLGIPLLLMVLLAYIALPRILGAPPKEEAADTSAADAAKAKAKEAAAQGRLRPATEAPPRRPGDVTKEGAM